jgi:hypothetical protein
VAFYAWRLCDWADATPRHDGLLGRDTASRRPSTRSVGATGRTRQEQKLGALFHFDEPWPRVPIKKPKFLHVNKALEVVRFNIHYCDWRARQDLLTIVILHNKVLKFI